MSSSPPPAGTGQEEVRMVSEEASLPLHAAVTGPGGDGGAPLASEDQADGSDGGEEDDAMDEDEDGGSDDSDMEDGEEEEEEEEDTDYCSGSSLESDEVDRVWENMKKKAAEGGDGMQHKNPAVASCCVCMEPWTSDGAHRICCIPCGHVYGRSCLEKWLRRCGGTVAKCPQCGESFEQKRIINLYGTEYLWNDCIHDQELKRLVCRALDQLKETSKKCLMTEERTLAMERMVLRIDEEMTVFRVEVASLMEKMTNMIVSKDGDDTATPTLTPDGMLKFLSQNWPELPRPHCSHE